MAKSVGGSGGLFVATRTPKGAMHWMEFFCYIKPSKNTFLWGSWFVFRRFFVSGDF